MSRKQIEKDFGELYIGQNPKQLAAGYYKKKRKEVVCLGLAGLLIVIMCFVNDWKNSKLGDNNEILRSENSSGKEEVSLQIKTEDGKWQDISVDLYPKEYSAEELEQLFSKACENLPSLILSENESLENVTSDLDLIQEMQDFPFIIRWESSNTKIIDEQGCLTSYIRREDEEIELTAIFQCGDWEKEYKINANVKAEFLDDFWFGLKEMLIEQEKNTRDDLTFELPSVYMEHSLQWRYPPANSAFVLGSLFLIIFPFIVWQKDQEIHKETKIRKEQLQMAFPDFISKLILFMEAGMSIKGALFRIAEDYQKRQKGTKEYLYEELLYICRQMKNGLSEKEGYELLGKRCNLACYKKLSGLLIQHLQKGGSSILETMRSESEKAVEEQRRGIQKRGEEMGTKLLFPMVIMLGIVMVFIMVPALFSFQM